MSRIILCLLCSGLALLTGPGAWAETHPGQTAFVDEIASQSNMSKHELNALLDKAQKRPSIIKAITRPAESLSWPRYRGIFMTEDRIGKGVAFYTKHHDLIEKTAREYGIPGEYLVAILGVETSYGEVTGNYKVLDALVTLGFYYPKRGSFFRSELKELLSLPKTKLAGSVDTLTGSYAGAQGWGQFMPSSIRGYAVDADHDGHIDMLHSLPDILASVANYFSKHGWRPGEPVAIPAYADKHAKSMANHSSRAEYNVASLKQHGYHLRQPADDNLAATLLVLDTPEKPLYWATFTNFYVITRYNHSPMYAMAVHQLAHAIKQGLPRH